MKKYSQHANNGDEIGFLFLKKELTWQKVTEEKKEQRTYKTNKA